MTKGPVVIDLEEDASAAASVADAPPVPERVPATGQAMQRAAGIAAPRASRLTRWLFGLAAALAGAMLSVAAWDFATSLLQRFPLLGWAVSAGFIVLVMLALVLVARELAALSRMTRVEGLRRMGGEAVQDLQKARAYAERLNAFYAGRQDLSWGQARIKERLDEVLDADAALALVETELLVVLDNQALAEVERASRQVATVTALVPLALADMITALVTSVRMIRRIAEIYGGRSGTLGAWKLFRMVVAHLMATGAVAVGDDLLEPVLGGSVLSKISRRFGEGLVNGALTARVGLAAMEVCRPLAYGEGRKPSVRGVIKRALTGLFSKETSA